MAFSRVNIEFSRIIRSMSENHPPMCIDNSALPSNIIKEAPIAPLKQAPPITAEDLLVEACEGTDMLCLSNDLSDVSPYMGWYDSIKARLSSFSWRNFINTMVDSISNLFKVSATRASSLRVQTILSDNLTHNTDQTTKAQESTNYVDLSKQIKNFNGLKETKQHRTDLYTNFNFNLNPSHGESSLSGTDLFKHYADKNGPSNPQLIVDQNFGEIFQPS